VVVKDGAGSILAAGSLGPGKWEKVTVTTPSGTTVSGIVYCVFHFALPGIPTEDFYTIEVSHRGELTYSYDDLKTQGWVVEFTLGY